ncbi:MAG: aconitase/3-isopropylmalate dehydratase large subunit family protein [Negativicutes bacterium]|nr:aconitase/3-isopropylmalate dehydratase large subunit family protein [Negativicutes bacterium]
MAGQTIAEKIFSRHAGKMAFSGDSVVAAVDVAMATDGSGPLALEFFKKMGGSRVFDPEKVVMVFDHYVPCPNDKVAAMQENMREFCRQGQCRLLDLGEGICHQLLPEKGYVVPGALIVGGDSHSTTYGAFNALGTGVGSSDLAAAMISGRLWFRVPESVKITLTGALQPRVTAKDIALTIVGRLGADGATYKAVEFAGVNMLTLSERMTVCNMMVETGAKCAIMPGDAITRAYFKREVEMVEADGDARYVEEIELDLAAITPVVALPHQVDTVVPVGQALGTPIQMGVLGTCTNGRVDDLKLALDVIGRQALYPGFELLVVPASRQVYVEALRQGLIERFAELGAMILPPGCGPCCGSSPGIPGAGENVLSTANRNFIGRMGNIQANIYLGSPATVAAAAVTGKISDPREL